MNITQSEYVASYPRVDLCPNSSLPEYAFIGRSNVGKSSLINMLTGRKTWLKRLDSQEKLKNSIISLLIDHGISLIFQGMDMRKYPKRSAKNGSE